jgi:hypothetical protein
LGWGWFQAARARRMPSAHTCVWRASRIRQGYSVSRGWRAKCSSSPSSVALSSLTVPAELLADGPDLPDGDALHMHLDERGHQRPLAALARSGQDGFVRLGLGELPHRQAPQRALPVGFVGQLGLELVHPSGRAFAGHGLHGVRGAWLALVPPAFRRTSRNLPEGACRTVDSQGGYPTTGAVSPAVGAHSDIVVEPGRVGQGRRAAPSPPRRSAGDARRPQRGRPATMKRCAPAVASSRAWLATSRPLPTLFPKLSHEHRGTDQPIP